MGYCRVNQVGSHVVLETDEPSHHRISVSDHKVPRIGTLNSILRAVADRKGFDRSEILGSLRQ